MTGLAALLLGVALVFSALDWVAVGRRIQPLEYVCKPAAAAAFLATALALDPASDGSRAWCCVALGSASWAMSSSCCRATRFCPASLPSRWRRRASR